MRAITGFHFKQFSVCLFRGLKELNCHPRLRIGYCFVRICHVICDSKDRLVSPPYSRNRDQLSVITNEL